MFHSQWNIENIKCLNWDLFSHFQFGVSNRSQNSLDGANKGLEEKVVLKMVITLKLTHMEKKSYERDPETLSPQGQRSFKME